MKRGVASSLSLAMVLAALLWAQLPKPGGSSSGGGSGGSGTPGGSSGQIQYNNAGAFGGTTLVPVANGGTNLASGTSGGILCYTGSGTLASSIALTASAMLLGGGAGACPTAQSFVLSGGTLIQRASECAYGTVDLATVFTNSATQEVVALTAIPAQFRYDYVLVRESTTVTGTPTLTVAMGQAGVGTDLTNTALLLKVGTQNYLYETPRPPAVGAGTYNGVLYFTSGTTLGNGSVGNFAGIVTWEACGKKLP